MNRWVDFRMLKKRVAIEQVLASYNFELERAGRHQLRGPCPLPTHGSERSRQSFSVDTAKNVCVGSKSRCPVFIASDLSGIVQRPWCGIRLRCLSGG